MCSEEWLCSILGYFLLCKWKCKREFAVNLVYKLNTRFGDYYEHSFDDSILFFDTKTLAGRFMHFAKFTQVTDAISLIFIATGGQ